MNSEDESDSTSSGESHVSFVISKYNMPTQPYTQDAIIPPLCQPSQADEPSEEESDGNGPPEPLYEEEEFAPGKNDALIFEAIMNDPAADVSQFETDSNNDDIISPPEVTRDDAAEVVFVQPAPEPDSLIPLILPTVLLTPNRDHLNPPLLLLLRLLLQTQTSSPIQMLLLSLLKKTVQSTNSTQV